MKSLTVLFLVIAMAFAGGCSSPSEGITSPRIAVDIGTKSFGDKKFEVAWIPGPRSVADSTLVAMAASTSPGLVRELSMQIAAAESQDVNLVIAGPNSAKTKLVFLDALSLVDRRLPRLHIVFLGSESDTQEVKTALAKFDAVFVPATKS